MAGNRWLESVHFEHITEIGSRVLIIGAGNTAMDCCRTSKRLGGIDVKVIARKPRGYFKASPWELEDAEEEQVEIVVNRSPKEYVIEDGRLVGMKFDQLNYDEDAAGNLVPRVIGEEFIPCDDVILAIGQENSFEWIERDIGIEFDEWDAPIIDRQTYQSTYEGLFFGGDAAFGPENIIWAVEHGHQAAISINNFCEDRDVKERLPVGMNLTSTKMSIHEWSFSNDFDPSHRREMRHVDLQERFDELNIEVEMGFSSEQAAVEIERCLNCDIQTVFNEKLCIECDACIDVCPVQCLTITDNKDEDALRASLTIPANNKEQLLFVSSDLPQTGRVMVKDENLCVHCSLCAERCPTGAWDMRKSALLIPYALDEKDTWSRKVG